MRRLIRHCSGCVLGLLVALELLGCSFKPEAPGDDSAVDAAIDLDAAIDTKTVDSSTADISSIDGEFQDSYLCQGYVVRSIPRSWDDAEIDCVVLGGHLVAIEGMTENIAVRALLVGPIYIGLRRSGGTFSTWTDGTIITYTNWTNGQPSGEDCGQMANDGMWFDAECTGVLSYVCECPS